MLNLRAKNIKNIQVWLMNLTAIEYKFKDFIAETKNKNFVAIKLVKLFFLF